MLKMQWISIRHESGLVFVNFPPSPAPQRGFSCENRSNFSSEFWFVSLYQNLNIQTVVSGRLKQQQQQ